MVGWLVIKAIWLLLVITAICWFWLVGFVVVVLVVVVAVLIVVGSCCC